MLEERLSGIQPIRGELKHAQKISENYGKTEKNTLINGRTVQELESQLSQYNSKTCDYVQFIEYLRHKNQLNQILSDFYSQTLFRKLKWNLFINRQKSESQMI